MIPSMLYGQDLGNALRAAMQMKGVGPTEVARAFGVKTPSVTSWQNTGRIHKRHMQRLVEYFADVVPASFWGLGGQFVRGSENENVTPALIGTHKVPLLSYVQAGNWKGVGESFHPHDADELLMTDLDLSDAAFALEIKGDSMLPEFRPGDRVIIEPAISPQPGDYVVAKNGEEEATFKKYRPRGVNERGEMIFELVPLNEDYPSMRSDVTPIRIIGVMVEHRKYRRRG